MRLDDPGYGIVPECLSSQQCEQLIELLSADPIARSRAGARHLMSTPAITTLANDDRLTDLAKSWLGSPAIPFRATLFEKSGAKNWLIPWHQDTALPFENRFDQPGWGPWSEKAGVISRVIALRVHLDASDADNGPLRVVPGSHQAGVLSDEKVAEFVSANDEVECCVPQGGVIAMRPLIIHSSSKVRSARPRRVLHIEYADSLQLAEGIRLAVV
jgi:ectoine hydroxylase-related dioxygenase (phytanoyl-CoA dioxygenase family)